MKSKERGLFQRLRPGNDGLLGKTAELQVQVCHLGCYQASSSG